MLLVQYAAICFSSALLGAREAQVIISRHHVEKYLQHRGNISC